MRSRAGLLRHAAPPRVARGPLGREPREAPVDVRRRRPALANVGAQVLHGVVELLRLRTVRATRPLLLALEGGLPRVRPPREQPRVELRLTRALAVPTSQRPLPEEPAAHCLLGQLQVCLHVHLGIPFPFQRMDRVRLGQQH